ncbi:MAG: hypothetical protein GY783_10650, partial [Gammaproteobacteria bacterium]|nr:hypothetical protein [Gammaproteobacteria bacterium]
MRGQILSIAAVFFGLLLLAVTRAEDGIQIVYQEPLEQVWMTHSTSSGDQKPDISTVRSLGFDAFGKRFDINLEVNRTLIDAMQRERLDARYEIYRGDIAGMPNSWARLVIADGVPRGMLWDGGEMWAIDVAKDNATGLEEAFIYRLSDLQIPPGALACSEISTAKNAGELAKAVISEVTANAAQGPGATSQIDFAVIADFEFTSDNGAATNTALITRMNNVDGIFSMQLGVQLNVNRIDTFPANNDPFSDELDASALLDELTDYRFATPAQHANGLTHLFTGRNLDTTTVGIAYTGALCSRGFGAGLTQGSTDVMLDTLIAAHEIGHNFGAPHDGTEDSPCESETGDFLMAPRLNGESDFSACSIVEMQDDINRASCITPLPSTDVALVAGGQPAAILLGNAAALTFDVNSVGTNTASGVNVAVAIPAGVALDSVTATAGGCTSGAGTASCAIGSIAAGSGVTVTIQATGAAVGSADFVASVSADTDANGDNNQATLQLTVDPAVDLVSTAATTVQVALNASTTIRPNIENRSSIVATNVTLTVTPDSGISIDSASWSPGSCSITDSVVTCQAASLGPQ